jgi:gliding motility-associated-like protein
MTKPILSFLFCTISLMNGLAQSFTNKGNAGFPQGYNSCVKTVDVDNDGLLDVFLTGYDGTSPYTRLYLNTGSFTFTAIATVIPDLSQARADWADFNNDGFADVVVSGITASVEKKCSIYKNNGDHTFTELASGIENVAYGSVLWADFDNDGHTDLFITGINQAGTRVAHIYKNVNNTFVLTSAVISATSSGAAVALDYDKDGKTDLLITGTSQTGQKVTLLYKNKGNFAFEAVNNIFEKITGGGIAQGDVDGNGFDDVVITGTNSSNVRITKLYLNKKGLFMEAPSAVFDSLSGSSVHIADFNNDGLPDVILTGEDNQLYYRTPLYINNGDSTFTDAGAAFPEVVTGDVAIADFDNDTKLDLVISGMAYSGGLTRIFQNNGSNSNHKPSVPAGLVSISKSDSVVLSWNKASDAETPADGLTYNIYVGSQAKQSNIVAPLASTALGTRLVDRAGNMGHANTYTLKGLDEGLYYWGVQCIDNSWDASGFSTEASFTVCHNLNIGNDTSLCFGDSIKLTIGTSTDTVDWYTLKHGLILSHSRTLHYSIKEDDQIIAKLRNTLGCTLYDTLSVKVIALPSFNIGNDTALCLNARLLLNAGQGWKSVSWYSRQNGLVASDTAKYEYTSLMSGLIYAKVTNQAGCVNYDSLSFTKLDLPVFTLGRDTNVCFHDSARLITTPSFQSIRWFSLNQTLLSVDTVYHYKVSLTDTIYAEVTGHNACKNTDTIVVNKLALPLVNIGNDTSICFKEGLSLHAVSNGGKIDWYSKRDGLWAKDTSSARISSVWASDTIRVLVTDVNGCTNSDSLNLTMLNLPDYSIGNDTAVCRNNKILFIAGTGWKNVDWYSSHNGLLISNSWFYNYTVTRTDTIWSVVTDDNLCVRNDSVRVVSWDLPAFTIGKDTAVCKNQFLQLTTGDGWKNTDWYSKDSGLLASNSSILDYESVSSDTLWAVVTDLNLCVANDTIAVSTLMLPSLNLPADTSLCFKDTLNTTVGDGWKSVNWRSSMNLVSAVTPGISLVVSTNDSLFVTVVNTDGCQNSDTTYVRMIPLPSVHLGNDTSICLHQKISLQVADTLKNVVWWVLSDSLISSGNNTLTYQPSQSETVVANIVSKAACKNSDTIVIHVNPLPVIDAGNDTLICYGLPVTLGGKPTVSGSGNYQYAWEPATNLGSVQVANPVAVAKDPIIYHLKVTDSNACVSMDSISIDVNPATVLSLPQSVAVCTGQSVLIGTSPVATGSRFPYAYQWSPDSSLNSTVEETPTANPLNTLTYRLIVSSWHCPADTGYVTVIVRPLPVVHVSPTLTIGISGYVQLYAEGGASYLWNPSNSLDQNDIADPIATPLESTLYTVMVTDSFGCSVDSSVQVIVANEVFVPGLFTPNNDNVNDVFKIYGFGILELSLKIVDRQNNVVFESIDVEEITKKGWDGSYEGKLLETGVYRWFINGRYINGETVLYKGKNSGIVNLIR